MKAALLKQSLGEFISCKSMNCKLFVVKYGLLKFVKLKSDRILNQTRLLVSVQSPECSDCLLGLRSSNNLKKLNGRKQNEIFFSKI